MQVYDGPRNGLGDVATVNSGGDVDIWKFTYGLSSQSVGKLQHNKSLLIRWDWNSLVSSICGENPGFFWRSQQACLLSNDIDR